MNEKSGLADALRDGLLLLASGLGLTLDPPALMGCFLLSTASAVLTRGFSPVLNQRRVYWLSLAAGVLTAVIFLLMDQAFSQRWPNDWPELPVQLLAILGGLFGPMIIPLMIKFFPTFAERLLGKYLPETPKN